MKSIISIRDLRNQFPKVRKMIETDGEVLLTEKGIPKYRISLYSPARVEDAPAVDYWERLNSYQPGELSAEQAAALHDENRGDR